MPLMPRTFRNRMALLCGALVVAVGLPGYLYITHVYAGGLLADRQQALTGLAGASASVLSQNLVERQRDIDLLAQSDTFRLATPHATAIPDAIHRLRTAYPAYSWIGLTNEKGVVKAATNGHLVGVDVSQRPWFSRGQQAPYVGDVHEAVLLAQLLAPQPGGQPLRFLDFAAPVVGADGCLKGVLAAHVHWRWGGDVLAAATPGDAVAAATEVLVVNAHNRVIFPIEQADTPVPVAALAPPAATGALFVPWGDGVRYMVAVAPVAEPVGTTALGWRVLVRQPQAVVLAGIHKLQQGVFLVSAAAALLLLVLVWWGTGRMTRSLERLTATARQVEEGAQHPVFETNEGAWEVQELGSALGRMSRSLLRTQEALAQNNQVLEARVLERTAELTRLNAALADMARTDSLTGLPNRHVATEQLHRAHADFKRSHQAPSVLVVDVDHFKRVNDNHGHAAGDAVLCQVARTLLQHVRETDVLTRVGGEEFVVILPRTPLAFAAAVANKLRRAVEATPVAGVGRVTVSIGVAEMVDADANADATVDRADRCLYAAKRAGRNRVSSAG